MKSIYSYKKGFGKKIDKTTKKIKKNIYFSFKNIRLKKLK